MQESIDEAWVEERLERWRTRRDAEALGELLKWQRDRAFATACRILPGGADAEDAVQQAFLKLLSRTHGFDSAGTFQLAVYRAVLQCALDLVRAQRVQARLEKAMSRVELQSTSHPRPEDAEALAAAWDEMKALTEEQRAMVVLCCQEGLSVSDAAEVLSLPRETLRDTLRAALEKLRRRLNARGITVSLLLLAALLRQGNALSAPPVLCQGLDAILQGESCARIFAQPAAPMAPGLGFLDPVAEGMRETSASYTWNVLKWVAGVAVIAIAVSTCWIALRERQPAPLESEIAALANHAKRAVLLAPKTGPVAPALLLAEQPRKEDVPPNPDAIPLAAVPREILDAAARALPGFIAAEAERKNVAGVWIYEIKGRVVAGIYEVEVTADGKVLEVEKDDDDDEDEKPKQSPKKNDPPAGDF